jgi:hypothetical protein
MFRFSPHVKVDRRWEPVIWKCFFQKRRKRLKFYPDSKLSPENPENTEKNFGKSVANSPKCHLGFGVFHFFRNAVHGNTKSTRKKSVKPEFLFRNFPEILTICKSVPETWNCHPLNFWNLKLLRRAGLKTGFWVGDFEIPKSLKCTCVPDWISWNFRKSGNGPGTQNRLILHIYKSLTTKLENPL